MPELSTVTLFGASGFIGEQIAIKLAQDGITVRAATRNPEKLAPLQAMAPEGKIVATACPTLSEREIGVALSKADAAINLIGVLYENKEQKFHDVHVRLARTLARVAKERGVGHFVHMSALNVSPKSKSAYSRSKAEGELAVREKFPEAVILRPSLVFGAEDHFFNKFSAMARYSPILPVIGSGATKFQPVFVGDVADAAIKALSLPDPAPDDLTPRVYELGGPKVYSFNGLMRLMMKASGQNRMLVSIPWGAASLIARLCEFLPHPPLTRDQIEMLRIHNILANPKAKTFADLDIVPAAAEEILPSYLGE